MANWIDACAADAIEEEGVIRFDHADRTFIIVRDDNDRYYCSDGLCTHEDIHLADGLVVENTIECPKHASIFNMETGEVKATYRNHSDYVSALAVTDDGGLVAAGTLDGAVRLWSRSTCRSRPTPDT